MPFPLLALVPALVAWGTRAVTAVGLAAIFTGQPLQDLKELLLGYVVDYAARYAGLELDAADPISDASFSHAVSLRVGFPIRSLKDRAMIQEDLDGFAAALISQKSGFVVRSVKDVDVLKQDLERVALAVLSQQVGIPLGSVGNSGFGLDPVEIKQQILVWAKAQLLADIRSGVQVEALELASWGDMDALVNVINSRAENGEVSVHGVALNIADKLAVEAVGDYQKVVVGMTKRARRQESLRAAQAKFRRLHGVRQKYVPLGMVAVVT